MKRSTYWGTYNHQSLRIGALTLMVVFISGCFSNILTKPKSKTTRAPGATTEAITFNESTQITISQVNRTTFQPTLTLDFIGDGSSNLGQYCPVNSNQGQNSTPNPCRCSFHYVLPNSSTTEHQETEMTYGEGNLVRCPFPPSIAGVSTLETRIHWLAPDLYSNALPFNTSPQGGSLDPLSILSFSPVTRYQCRDSVFVSHIFSSNIYDPFRSENPLISYPMNFYTSNYGKVIDLIGSHPNTLPQDVGGVKVGWFCPSNASITSGFDLTIKSVDPLVGGNNLIYSNSGAAATGNRYQFFVARSPIGPFNVPLNAYIGPNLPSNAQGTALVSGSEIPPVGYVAHSIPNNNGGESCPSDTIPQGYHWVKIWQFRASLDVRQVPKQAQLENLGAILCDPSTAATWANNGGPVVNSCGIASYSANTMHARILAGIADNNGPACMKPVQNNNSLWGAGGSTVYQNPNYVVTKPTALEATTSEPGSDLMQLIIPTGGTQNALCTTQGAPGLNLCPASGAPTVQVPRMTRDSNDAITIDTASRFDYLFTVSPTTVHSSEFIAQSSLAKQYTPYRHYYTNSALTIPYAYTDTDMSLNNNGGSAPHLFPLCAIQEGP